MKLTNMMVLAVMGSLITGCATTSKYNYQSQGQASHQRASNKDCNNVYNQIVKIAVSDLNITPQYKNYDAVVFLVDNEYQTYGAKDRFLNSCNLSMSKAQAQCDLVATTLDDMTICSRLLPKYSK